jgi:uncharacterized membrane protein HdeD (DUF308 family)
MTESRRDPAGSAGVAGASQADTSQQPSGTPATGSDFSTASGTAAGGGVGTQARTATVPQQGRQRPEEPGWSDESDDSAAVYRGDRFLAAAASASWAAVLLGGLCMIAAGICLLVWPKASLTVVAVLIGLALIVSGLVRLYEGFTAHGESAGMRTAYIVIGLLALLAGLYCLRHHALSILLVAFVTGVYFIMHGIADIGVAATVHVEGRGLRALLGVFSIAAGIIMVAWPALTLVLLLTLVGAWLLFYGCVLIFTGFSLRRAGRKMSSSPAPRLAASA